MQQKNILSTKNSMKQEIIELYQEVTPSIPINPSPRHKVLITALTTSHQVSKVIPTRPTRLTPVPYQAQYIKFHPGSSHGTQGAQILSSNHLVQSHQGPHRRSDLTILYTNGYAPRDSSKTCLIYNASPATFNTLLREPCSTRGG